MSPRAACAAPGARSWVGWVRVAGAAGVIDALVAWQGQATSVVGSAGTVQVTPLRRGHFVFTEFSWGKEVAMRRASHSLSASRIFDDITRSGAGMVPRRAS